MKVLYPIEIFYPSNFGGPSNTIYWQSCELTNKQIEVHIITTDYGIDYGNVQTDIEEFKECGYVTYYKYNRFKKFIGIYKKIKKVDIIHLNSLFSIFSIFSFFLIKLSNNKKRIIWSPRGELDSNALKFSKIKKKIVLLIYKKLAKNILFHSTSFEESNLLKKTFGKIDIIEIPNFIKAPKRLFLTKKKQILYIGRIHPIKALHKLIEAVGLSEEFIKNNFKLIIVGKFEDRHKYYYDELIELIKSLNLESMVIFKGHIQGNEKEEIISESYCLVLPSESENFGNVVIEALNQGTPVIASKGTPWSILEDYDCGIHSENNPQKLSENISKIITINNYNEICKNSIKLVDDKFNINNGISYWIEVYSKLLKNATNKK